MSDAAPAPVPSPVPWEDLLAQRAWVRAVARSLVRDPARADDLEQQAWAAALERPPSDARSLRGWLGTVVRRAAGKGRREAWRRDRRERAAARPDRAPSTLEVVARAEWHERVVRAVLDLPEPYRTTILLRYLEDLPPREVAVRMGAPVETVRSRAQRGLALLREQLDANPGGRTAWAPALAGLALSDPPAAWPGDDPAWGDVPVASTAAPAPVAASSAATAAAAGALLVLPAWLRTAAIVLVVGGALALGLLAVRGSPPAPPPGEPAAPGTEVADARRSPGLAAPPAGAPAAPSSPTPAAEAVPAAAPMLVGRVTRASDGSPVAGARVVAVAVGTVLGGGADYAETTTDEAGRYAFQGFPGWLDRRPSEATVLAQAPGLAAEGLDAVVLGGWNPRAVALPDAGTARCDLRLVADDPIRGRVVDPAGNGVARVEVEAWWRVGTPWGSETATLLRALSLTRTDEEGRFLFSGWGRGQPVDLVALLPGELPARPAGSWRSGEEAVVLAPPPRYAEVRVLGAAGDPVAGALVTAREPAVRDAGGGTLLPPRAFRRAWATGQDGWVRIGPLPAGSLRLDARSGDGDGAARGGATLASDADCAEVRVVRRPVWAPTGPATDGWPVVRVEGPDGAPVAFMSLLVWVGQRERDGMGFGFGQSFTEGPGEGTQVNPLSTDGSAVVEVLQARDARGERLPLAAATARLPATGTVTLRLQPEQTLAVRVVGPSGDPLQGAAVSARPARWDAWPHPQSGGPDVLDIPLARARAEADGVVRLRGLAPEPYRLTVSGPPGLVLAGDAVFTPGRDPVTLRLVRAP